MRIVSLALLGVLALAACAEAPSDPAMPLKVSANLPAERMFGTAQSRVRVVERKPGQAKTQLTGASCRIVSKHLRGATTSPGRVSYPMFIQAGRFPDRGKPGPMQVTCKAGDRSGIRVVQPVWQNVNGRPSTGPTQSDSVQVSLVPISGALTSSYPWVYPSVIEVEVQ